MEEKQYQVVLVESLHGIAVSTTPIGEPTDKETAEMVADAMNEMRVSGCEYTVQEVK